MNLLLVSQDFPPSFGGIQTYSFELGRRLHDFWSMVEIIAPSDDGDSRIDDMLPGRVHRIDSRDDLLGLAILHRLPGMARRFRPDVALHVQWSTAMASLISRRLTGYPRRVVIAAHGRELLTEHVGGRLYSDIRRRILSASDLVIANSRYTADLVRDIGIEPERIRVANPGTDPDHFHPRDTTELAGRLGVAGRPVLFTSCRLVERKGVDTTLKALVRVIEEIPEVVYLIAGEGQERARLENLIGELGLGSHVQFLGRLRYHELPLYFSLADVFVMPARDESPDVEGFGIVFLEANACGTPVIGGRSGGVTDAVVDGETGLLVEPGDPDELASAIIRLLADPKFARSLAEAGRQRVIESANWSTCARLISAEISLLFDGSPDR